MGKRKALQASPSRRGDQSGRRMWSWRLRELKLENGASASFTINPVAFPQDAFSNMARRDLRAVLQTLSDQSLKTSRRLDDTYYSILEKVSVLRQTIGTLQELSGLTKELHENFESDTTELLEDVTGQVEAFDGFKTQQEQVSGLEERIKTGKEKADALTARLERAKERVDARARSEAQWQAKNTRMAILMTFFCFRSS
jgi:predicted RNase H-like nuclease (RuvC/YqgF family)